MTKDQKIAKLAREISDYYATMLRLKEVTPESPEYLGINSALKFTAVKYDQNTTGRTWTARIRIMKSAGFSTCSSRAVPRS